MNDSKQLLKSILGAQGYETLAKAIYKQKTNSVVDPLEFYLPLMVVPRTIISWLVQNIRPMKPGNLLDIDFPGRPDIKIHFEKQADDVYRAEFVQSGKVIHTFDKQSLPSISGHLMTVGELYDSFNDEKPAEPKEGEGPDLSGPKAQGPDLDMVRSMMSLSNCKPPEDPENIKWQMSHSSIREMTSVIGKLVDALTAKQLSRDRLENELDKAAEKEVKDQQGKLTEGKSAEQVGKDHDKDLNKNPDIKEPGKGILEVRDLKTKDNKDLLIDPKPKVAPESKGRVDTPSKETPFKKDTMAPTPVPAPRKMAEGERIHAHAQPEKPFKKDAMAQHAPADTASPKPSSTQANGYFRKKAELLSKPYVSDAQRRWAHTNAGTKALGGAAHVHEWDESTKGKKLPEHVKKDAMDPAVAQAVADKINDADSLKLKIKKEEKGKEVTSHSSPSGAGGTTNAKKPAGNGMPFPLLAAEKPAGAGQPNGPAKPIAPKAPVPPSNAPAAAAAKQGAAQADASGTGGYKPPKTPGAQMPKNPTMAKCDYFRSKLGKSIKSSATEEQLYKSTCPNCGVPEFKKDKSGQPTFNPCACFLVMKKDEEGKPYKFVQVLKKADGNFNLAFAKDADPEVVKLFLLTLKSALLIKRKFGVL